ncbi:uncharacterized protein LOC129234318 [Uloborus diversus]|uniref:uncharacterized protein LOC129234318 n=1 Tax=Uloborus diversus TaxID=327109 RepID=UPI00240A25A2|nr:uncharacterized protein LOC129234318 [Uloborus diversus]
MTDIACTVRHMGIADIPQVLDLWRESGLHHTPQSLSTWLEVDPYGFYVAVSDAGEVLGICSAVFHHNDLAFVGSYYVKREYRGQGIGRKVLNACNDHIGSRNAALNAMPEMVPFFRDTCGYSIVKNKWVCLFYMSADSLKLDTIPSNRLKEFEIRLPRESDLSLMFEYFFKIIGYRLDLAIRLNCEEVDSRTYVAFKEGVCVGFGSIKISCNGAGEVGPLYADSTTVAEILLKKLILSFPRARGFVIKTVRSNSAANDLAQRFGWSCPELYPRLYRKKILNADINKVFALFSMSFAPF